MIELYLDGGVPPGEGRTLEAFQILVGPRRIILGIFYDLFQKIIFESEKEGRALIKRLQIATAQKELEIHLLNEHSRESDIPALLKTLENGFDAGLMSDAGIPCVADPVEFDKSPNTSLVPPENAMLPLFVSPVP